MSNSLTRYPAGSIRELWSVSLPLMISALASLFMIFTDRIFLSRYSVDALNASVNAGSTAWALMCGFAMITSMSEVFVAQYNGAKRYDRLGKPVWQMIWVSLFSLVFFIPMAIWGGPAIFGADRNGAMEIEYFRWLTLFSPSYALVTAFAGFFIGRGQTQMMIWLAIAANLINIVLDWALIFGVPGFIPEMGVQGAAIATCFGYFFESAALGYLFLRKENRIRYGTADFRFDWEEMKKCWKVGFPQGVFCTLEVLGWAVFYWMMTSMGEKHITISSICQSFTILLSFFCDGLCRGAAAVAGNFIGAKKHEIINKVFRSGLILILMFALVTFGFLVIDPIDTVRFLFFEHFEAGHLVGAVDTSLVSSLKTCMIFAFAYLFFEGIRWILGGILSAAGDTMFLLIAGSLSIWIFLLAPLYLIVVRLHLPVEYAWGLTVGYSILFAFIYWIRFRRGDWQKIDLVTPSDTTTYTALETQELLQPAADQSE